MYAALQTIGAKVDRVCEILETEPEVVDRQDGIVPKRVTGHLTFENVTFGYETNRRVLDRVSLEASPGETIAIVGPTGAGKSTLVSMIPRFFDPWEGRVLLDGRDLRDYRVAALRKQVALVLQEPFLFPFSIAQNIAYGVPDATEDHIEQAARDANAHEFIARLPKGYDTAMGERGATLSGGERQRIAIARALLRQPPILILDEPTSALDAGTEDLILQALERLMKGRTTFVIAHRLTTIRKADKIVVMENGQVRQIGNHDELLEQGGTYARFHAIQTGVGGLEGSPAGQPVAVS